MTYNGLYCLLIPAVLAVAVTGVRAQSLDLTVGDTGLSIGDSRRVNGLRLNFRDRRLEEVNGINLTLWGPFDASDGVVNGLALGVPATGAGRIHGLGIAPIGIEVHENLEGIALGGLGVGSGEHISGIAVGGLGVGAGSSVRGLTIGGLGVGTGGDLQGIMIGGLGAGGGGDATGIMIGGLGAGAGGSIRGLGVGGLGIGSGGDVTGIMIGGLGVGAGGDVTGIMIGGAGVGAGGLLKGLAIGGIGVGAPEVRGILLSGVAAGGGDVAGFSVAPAYFVIDEDGRFAGLSVSAFNRIRGEQHGITIGVFNYARRLRGLQIGVLNYAGNNPRGLRWLPILNANLR